MKIKIWVLVYKNISKLIEVQSNVLFLSAFAVKVDVKMREKFSRMWENAYLSIKNPQASGALSRP